MCAVNTDEEVAARARAIEAAMVGAMAVPEEAFLLIRDVFRTMNEVATCVGGMIASDLGSGAELLKAASESAYMNVRINAQSLEDRALAESAMDRVETVRREIHDMAGAIREIVEKNL